MFCCCLNHLSGNDSSMLKLIFFGYLLLLTCLSEVGAEVGTQCSPTDLTKNAQCSDGELCDMETQTCQCRPGYSEEKKTCFQTKTTEKVNTSTIRPSKYVAPGGHGSVVAGILVPLTLLLIMVSAVYISKKYNVFYRLRSRFFRRSSNYDEFMIGADDDDVPPLR